MAQQRRRLRQQLMELSKPQLIHVCDINHLSKHGEKAELINRLVRFELKQNKSNPNDVTMNSLDILSEYISYFGHIPTIEELICYSAYRINAETLSPSNANEIINIYTKNLHKFRKSKTKGKKPAIPLKQSKCTPHETKTHRKTIKIPTYNQKTKHKRSNSDSTHNIALRNKKKYYGDTRTRKKLKHNELHQRAIQAYNVYHQQQLNSKSQTENRTKMQRKYQDKQKTIQHKGGHLRLQLMINRALELKRDANFVSVTLDNHTIETKIVKSERNPQFFEIFIFPRFVPKVGKTCIILVGYRSLLFFGKDKIIGTAKLELLTECQGPKIQLVDIYDSDNKLSGLVSVKQSII
eukprot:988320_1